MEDISIWSKGKVIDSDSRFCVRIVTNDCIYFLQVKIFSFRFESKFFSFLQGQFDSFERSMVLFDSMESMFHKFIFIYKLFRFFFQRNKLKFERILRSAHRPEILLKEMTVKSSIENDFRVFINLNM